MTHSFDKRHIRAVAIGLASVVIVVLIASAIVAGWPPLAKGLSGKTLYWFMRAQPRRSWYCPSTLAAVFAASCRCTGGLCLGL